MKRQKVDYLIVIDMQNDFVTGALGTPEAQAIVPKVVEKIKNWDGAVIYTQDTHHGNYLKTQEGKHLPVVHCQQETWGWQFVDAVEDTIPLEDNGRIAIYKKHAFGSRDLMNDIYTTIWDNEILYSHVGFDYEPKSITLVGLCTDICVISNAIMLKSTVHEIPIIVDASCCAGVTPESHKNALAAMKACQIEIINE